MSIDKTRIQMRDTRASGTCHTLSIALVMLGGCVAQSSLTYSDVMEVKLNNGNPAFIFPQEGDLDYTSVHSNQEWTNLGTLMSETITFEFTSGNTYVVDVVYFLATTGGRGACQSMGQRR